MNNWKSALSELQTFLKETFEEKIPLDMATHSLSVAKHNAYFHEHSMSELLPYEVFDEKTGLFHNRDTKGFLLETIPLEGLSEESMDMLTVFLQDKLPTGSTFQLLLIVSPDISGMLSALFNNRSKRGGVFKILAQKRCDFLKENTTHSFLKSEDFLMRDFKLIWSVSVDKNTNEAVILKLKEEIEFLLKSLKMPYQCLMPEGLMRWVRLLMNPYGFAAQSAHTPHYQPDVLLASQVTPSDTNLCVTAHQLSINEGESAIRLYRLTEYPSQWMAAFMNELIGDPMRSHLRLGYPFVLSMIIHAGSSEAEKTRLQAMNLRSHQKAASTLSNLIPNLKALDSDLKYAVKQLDDGDKILKACFQVGVYGTHDTIQKGAAQCEALLTAKKFKFARCRYMQLPAFLSLLPMGINRAWVNDISRFNWFKTQLASTSAQFLPIQAENKGMNSAMIPILGRRGQLAFYDAFTDSQGGNYNAITVGAPGSGKSNFNQEKILSRLGAGGRVFIIDVGGSYEKDVLLLEDMGAQYVEFTPQTKISLNPFSNIDSKEMAQNPSEYMPLLKAMVSQMASPAQALNALQLSFLEDAIMDTWRQYAQQSSITHIAQYLKASSDSRARDLGQMLSPYTDKGSYGNYFQGPCTINFDSPLVCFELEGLNKKKDLQSVVLMLLIYQITQAMYFSDRKTKITCLIDEAWDIIEKVQGSAFLNDTCRRARKYNGSMNICTQSLDDLFSNPVIKSAHDACSFLEILRQESGVIQRIIKKGELAVTPLQAQILSSLSAKSGEYAEIAIKGPEFFLAGRLIWDPYHAQLYSSKPSDFVAVKKRIKEGLSIDAAIQEMVEKKHEQK